MKWSNFNAVSRMTARDCAFGLLFLLYMFAHQTYFFYRDPLLSLMGTTFKLIIPILFLLIFKRYVPPPTVRLLLCGYVALIFVLSFAIIYSEDVILVFVNTAKYLFVVTFAIALCFILRPQTFSFRILQFPVVMGAVFAVQTLILFALVQLGHPPDNKEVILTGYKNLPFLSYGIWGYGWGSIAAGASFQVYRAQSFFGEPTRLASFQEVCIFLSYGFYKATSRRVWLWISLLCALDLVICFSMTGYVAIFLTTVVYFGIRYWRRLGYLAPVIQIVGLVVATLVVILYLQQATEFYSQSESFLNLAFGHSSSEVTYRVNFFFDSLRLFANHPFGIGVIGVEDSRIRQNFPGAGGLIAPLEWLVTGGLPALIIQVGILFVVLKRVAIPHIAKGGFGRYLGLAFIALVFHHCVAGDWLDPTFFLVLFSLVMFDRANFIIPGTKLPPSGPSPVLALNPVP